MFTSHPATPEVLGGAVPSMCRSTLIPATRNTRVHHRPRWRWEALIFTAAYSDSAGARWPPCGDADVDLDRRTLRVTRKLAEVTGDLSFGPP